VVSEIKVRYRVSTPMFSGGADPKIAELRLPSFKGVLRFWWRASAWSRMNGDLGTVKDEEDRLFGSAGGGQSQVSMWLAPNGRPDAVSHGEVLTVEPGSRKVVGEGARYLGYGVMEAFASRGKGTEAGQLTRGCLSGGFTFTVRMRLRDNRCVGTLKQALILLGLVGGMGAKSRKGYGSLVLESIHVDGREEWRTPRSIDELAEYLRGIGQIHSRSVLPEYTALSGLTRVILAASSHRHPLDLLDLVGREMMRYRSWGHNGRVLRESSEHNFKDDHDLMKKLPVRISHPKRIAFGLPHNYGSVKAQQVGLAGGKLDRRASPLFIHIHMCGDRPVAVLSFLPARFLPKGTRISVGGRKVGQAPEGELYQPIHDFLGRMTDGDRRIEPFTEVVEV